MQQVTTRDGHSIKTGDTLYLNRPTEKEMGESGWVKAMDEFVGTKVKIVRTTSDGNVRFQGLSGGSVCIAVPSVFSKDPVHDKGKEVQPCVNYKTTITPIPKEKVLLLLL